MTRHQAASIKKRALFLHFPTISFYLLAQFNNPPLGHHDNADCNLLLIYGHLWTLLSINKGYGAGDKGTKTGGNGGGEKNMYFLDFLLVGGGGGVSKQRGAIKKQREEEVGEQGALPLAQALINTRPPDRK